MIKLIQLYFIPTNSYWVILLRGNNYEKQFVIIINNLLKSNRCVGECKNEQREAPMYELQPGTKLTYEKHQGRNLNRVQN